LGEKEILRAIDQNLLVPSGDAVQGRRKNRNWRKREGRVFPTRGEGVLYKREGGTM